MAEISESFVLKSLLINPDARVEGSKMKKLNEQKDTGTVPNSFTFNFREGSQSGALAFGVREDGAYIMEPDVRKVGEDKNTLIFKLNENELTVTKNGEDIKPAEQLEKYHSFLFKLGKDYLGITNITGDGKASFFRLKEEVAERLFEVEKPVSVQPNYVVTTGGSWNGVTTETQQRSNPIQVVALRQGSLAEIEKLVEKVEVSDTKQEKPNKEVKKTNNISKRLAAAVLAAGLMVVSPTHAGEPVKVNSSLVSPEIYRENEIQYQSYKVQVGDTYGDLAKKQLEAILGDKAKDPSLVLLIELATAGINNQINPDVLGAGDIIKVLDEKTITKTISSFDKNPKAVQEWGRTLNARYQEGRLSSDDIEKSVKESVGLLKNLIN